MLTTPSNGSVLKVKPKIRCVNLKGWDMTYTLDMVRVLFEGWK